MTFEASPVKWKLGPVPLLTIFSFFWLVFLGVGTYYYLTEDYLYANKPIMLLISLIVFVAAFPVYFLVKAWRKSQGIDIGLAYAEIPPE